jgi:hypothetical protein
LTVLPAEIPKICVCTAPATPTVHKSEFEIFIVGVIADGGGDFTVVFESVTEFTVLFVVDSVTIGCAFTRPRYIIDKTLNTNFFICTSILLTFNTKNDKITNNFLYL